MAVQSLHNKRIITEENGSYVDDGIEDSFTVSGSIDDEKEAFGESKYSSMFASRPCPSYGVQKDPTSDVALQSMEEDEDVFDRDPSSSNSDATLSQKPQGCGERCKRLSKQFKSAQRHRRCPHSFRICLVFSMFILLGILERGSFVVLFNLLNTHSLLKPGETTIVYLVIKFFIYIMYPVTGFLADTFYGHHKVIRTCLCVAWLGSAFTAFSLAFYNSMDDTAKCNHHLDHCWPVPILAILGIGYAILGVGLTGIRVNLIPFGADQLPDASGGELSSYFHWYYFCVTFGHLMAVLVLPEVFKQGSLAFVFLGLTIVITLFLSIFVLFHKQWLILPKKGNPLKLVYGVIKASLNTQKPIKMSAFDVGMAKPSRMDRTMIKYGGMYTLEQVEAVKTFFRLLVIAMSCIGYYAVFSQLQSTTTLQSYRMDPDLVGGECTAEHKDSLRDVANGIGFKCQQWKSIPGILFGAANLFPLLLFVPIYDRLVYMFLSGWRWFSMLTRIAVGNLFILASVLSAIVIEGVRMEMLWENLRLNETVTINALSFHKGITIYDVASPLPSFYLAIPFVFFSFAELFSNITAAEFIYAQSPGNMKGMLIGMLFASEGLAIGLSALVLAFITGLVPSYHFCSFFGNTRTFYSEMLDITSTCRTKLYESTSFIDACSDGVMFGYFIFGVIAVISAVIFVIAAVNYKRRRRDQDPYMPIWLIPEDKLTTVQYIIRKCCC